MNSLRCSEQRQMSSLRRLRRRQRSSAPAAPPDDDDLLTEIFLRLPPQPSSLPRASFVCKRWRRIISDPAFLRRFRTHHRRNSPLLGCFTQALARNRIHFHPTLEAPDRLHPERFRLQLDDADRYRIFACRHGLLLIFQDGLRQLLVWDPITGDQHHLNVPPAFDIKVSARSNGAVLRAAGDVHFQVVLLYSSGSTGNHNKQTRVVASVYSSETGVWGNLISILLPPKVSVSSNQLRMTPPTYPKYPSVLIGNSFYWLLSGNSHDILEFDMDTQSLSVIPGDIHAMRHYGHHIMRADGGGLGMFILLDFSAQLWKRETDCDGIASWVMGKTIELDRLLSPNPKSTRSPTILGFAEDKNVVFLWTDRGIFMVKLQPLQFKNLFKYDIPTRWYPFESVYTETSIGGGHDGAELLQNT